MLRRTTLKLCGSEEGKPRLLPRCAMGTSALLTFPSLELIVGHLATLRADTAGVKFRRQVGHSDFHTTRPHNFVSGIDY